MIWLSGCAAITSEVKIIWRNRIEVDRISVSATKLAANFVSV